MQHIQPLLLPQPCQSQAHRNNDRTVPNPCFTSPQTVHIRVRILNLFHRALLCYFIAYHHDNKTPIHLLIAGHTTSGSGLVYSIQGSCMSSSPPSCPESMRLAHKAKHTIRSRSAQVSNPIT